MALVKPPTITTQVNQNFFIEALGGAKPISSYLDRFPDSLYTKSIDSLLVTFLYALLGPTGVGQLRQEYLEARLQIEEAGLSTADLDSLYTNAFAFARLADETYQLDADASLLPAATRAQILSQDSDFRNRATYFLKGARAGGTLQGVTLAARSGLDRPVEVVENWQQLYDRYSDQPLGLPVLGQTTRPNEIIVIPRQVQPQSSVQTLQITGSPVRGYFTLSFPPSQNWRPILVTTTAGSNVISVPDVNKFPSGVFVTITTVPPGASAAALNPYLTPWGFTAIYGTSLGPYQGSTSQIQISLPSGTIPFSGSHYAFVGYAQTSPLPYNASAAQIQNALTALPPIGPGNVVCTGGPLPNIPVQCQFANQLANTAVSTLVANLSPDIAVGINATGNGGTEQMSDINNSPLTIGLTPVVTVSGISAANQQTTIAPGDMHSMLTAIDQIRPLTSYVTTIPGSNTMIPQPVQNTFSGSNSVEVLRYVTGRSSVPWPPIDNTHWIQGGLEHEAPRPVGNPSNQYTGFHNIVGVQAYTEAALDDAAYVDGNPATPLSITYWDTLVGNFSGDQLTLMPGLLGLSGVRPQFDPNDAPAPTPEPLVISNVAGQGVINGVYPTDYMSLPGVSQPVGQHLWASSERSSGTDYLEIDLGQPQAVNYISFQITSKPFTIDVAYDALDQAPARNFIAAQIAPVTQGVSATAVVYNSQKLWTDVQLHLSNSIGGMIYTRFIRIGFTRNPDGTPYALPIPNQIKQPSTQTAGLPLWNEATYTPPPIPSQYTYVAYSTDIQNLRIGRNVSASSGGHPSATRAGTFTASILPSGTTQGTVVSQNTLFPGSNLFPSPNLFP